MNRSKVQLWVATSAPHSKHLYGRVWSTSPFLLPPPPSLWLRFEDYTFVINKAEHIQDFLHHINNQDPHIQFPVEPTQQDSLPFLDTLITIQPDNTFSTTVYRKPTHTDQYLHCNSNHHITAKQSVFNTLAHRAKTVSSTQASMDKELDHMKTALKHCQFPSWALNQWQHRFNQSQQHSNNPSNNSISNMPTDQKQGHHSCTLHTQYKGKIQKSVQKKRNSGTFLRLQHSQYNIRNPQGQGPQSQPDRHHLPLPMPQHKLP